MINETHDDYFLLRWLRGMYGINDQINFLKVFIYFYFYEARKWNPEAAEEMLRAVSYIYTKEYILDRTLTIPLNLYFYLWCGY